MNTAYVIKMSETQTWIHCPYCDKTHIHGNGGNKHIFGESRESHCHRGEYIIYDCEENLDDDDETRFEKAHFRQAIKFIGNYSYKSIFNI